MNGIQTYRNPRPVHVFDKQGMIENFGTGIPRTIYSYNNYIENESINDQINDLGLAILQILNVKPGLRIPELILEIENNGIETTVDKVRNEIRRNLRKYVKHRGSNKTGGYYLKDRHIDKQDKVE